MYKTFSARMPIQTHFKDVTCAEYECDAYLFGWDTTVDTSTELGQKRYHFITHDRTRSYSHEKVSDTLHIFHYGPGQTCFAPPNERGFRHKQTLLRPPRLITRGGDWRGYTSEPYEHTKVDFWVEDMQENFDGIRDRIDTGG